jgi:hypothetical protein
MARNPAYSGTFGHPFQSFPATCSDVIRPPGTLYSAGQPVNSDEAGNATRNLTTPDYRKLATPDGLRLLPSTFISTFSRELHGLWKACGVILQMNNCDSYSALLDILAVLPVVIRAGGLPECAFENGNTGIEGIDETTAITEGKAVKLPPFTAADGLSCPFA